MSDATLVYDDDCGFCTWSAELIAENSDLRIVGFSALTDELRERLPADYEECAHLVTADEVYSCGEAMEEAFVRSDLGRAARPFVNFARNFEEHERFRERGYRWIADNRDLFGKVVSKSPPARERDR
jgi:predicted DCC family thiol-disulfide oxidoreductase YuxK